MISFLPIKGPYLFWQFRYNMTVYSNGKKILKIQRRWSSNVRACAANPKTHTLVESKSCNMLKCISCFMVRLGIFDVLILQILDGKLDAKQYFVVSSYETAKKCSLVFILH